MNTTWTERAMAACEAAIQHWLGYQNQAIATKLAYRAQGDKVREACSFKNECFFSGQRARAQETLHRLHTRERHRAEVREWDARQAARRAAR